MAQIQISEFENRLKKIIINSCATCIAFYIDSLDLQNPLCISQLIGGKKILKFFYDHLKNGDYDKNVKNALRRRRLIKIKMHHLHEDIIKTTIRAQKLRDM